MTDRDTILDALDDAIDDATESGSTPLYSSLRDVYAAARNAYATTKNGDAAVAAAYGVAFTNDDGPAAHGVLFRAVGDVAEIAGSTNPFSGF